MNPPEDATRVLAELSRVPGGQWSLRHKGKLVARTVSCTMSRAEAVEWADATLLLRGFPGSRTWTSVGPCLWAAVPEGGAS